MFVAELGFLVEVLEPNMMAKVVRPASSKPAGAGPSKAVDLMAISIKIFSGAWDRETVHLN